MKNSDNRQTGQTPEPGETRWDPEKKRYTQSTGHADDRQTHERDMKDDPGNIPDESNRKSNGSLTQDDGPE